MMWLLAIVVVLVLGGVAVVAAGRGEPMTRAYDDRPDALVPADRPLAGRDLRRLRFSVALRGYRMSEVDALLARLAGELDDAAERASAPEPRAGANTAARPETDQTDPRATGPEPRPTPGEERDRGSDGGSGFGQQTA